MRALAVESSGRLGSIALAQDGQVLIEEQFAHGLKNAAQIIPVIDRLCRGRGWGPRDLEHVYVSAGPGSFTGLRIGITLAKTLAFATGVKLVAVPTVRVLAENAPGDTRHVVIVLDAKRGQIFTARLERAGEEWIEREPAHLDSLAAMIGRAPRPVYLLGEGLPYHLQFIAPDDPQIVIAPQERWRAKASAVVKVGLSLALRGQFADAYTLTPIYIRLPEAEEKYDAQHVPGKTGTEDGGGGR